jgi:hypothetical protein
MAYVREKKVPGKGGKTYSYYQLVEGKRVNGKVVQHVIAHLGKHDSIESARAAAANVVPKEVSPSGNLEKLRELNAEYLEHFQAYLRRSGEANDIYYKLRSLRGQRSKDATRQRKLLKIRQARISSDSEQAAEAVQHRAASIYDALSPAEQEKARALALAVVNHIEQSRESEVNIRERMPWLS